MLQNPPESDDNSQSEICTDIGIENKGIVSGRHKDFSRGLNNFLFKSESAETFRNNTSREQTGLKMTPEKQSIDAKSQESKE